MLEKPRTFKNFSKLFFLLFFIDNFVNKGKYKSKLLFGALKDTGSNPVISTKWTKLQVIEEITTNVNLRLTFKIELDGKKKYLKKR